jgi:hypothetical protein
MHPKPSQMAAERQQVQAQQGTGSAMLDRGFAMNGIWLLDESSQEEVAAESRSPSVLTRCLKDPSNGPMANLVLLRKVHVH